jgi:4-amino-4-deoxy-L-arabinose transferase-like glycosyltransferase
MRPRRFELSVLALFGIIIGYQLFVGPLLGVADNGDFPRLLQPAGLVERTTEYGDRYFQYFNSQYSIAPQLGSLPDYKSSSVLFVYLARGLNIAFIDHAVFDVRVLAALYLLSFLVGIYLILVSSRRMTWPWRVALAAALLFMFTDPAYTAYFNSFYSEPTALVCLLLLVGCSLILVSGQTASWVALAGYFLAAAVLITAKPMFVVFAPLVAPHGMYLSRFTAAKSRYWLGGGLACGLLLLASWYQAQTPARLRSTTHYIAIFSVLLKDSAAPERDVRDLGLKPEWIRYAGTSPYSERSPALDSVFDAEFVGRVNSLTVPTFFLRHPRRFHTVVSRVAKKMSITRLTNAGYYEKKTGKPPFTKPPAPWSDVRRWLMPGSIWFFVAYFLSGLVALGLGTRKHVGEPRRGLLLLYGFLTAFSALVFFVPVLAAGGFDIRYAITFVAAFDATLILALGAALWWASGAATDIATGRSLC